MHTVGLRLIGQSRENRRQVGSPNLVGDRAVHPVCDH